MSAESILNALAVDSITPESVAVGVVDGGDGRLAVELLRLGARRVVVFRLPGVPASQHEPIARELGVDWPQDETTFVARSIEPYELPVPDEEFGLILWDGSVGALRDHARMFGEIRRVTEPQGHVVVAVPNRGDAGIDVIARAMLSAGIDPSRVELGSASVRLDIEARGSSVADRVSRGAVIVGFRAR